MDHPAPPPAWLETLAAAEADLQAGRFVDSAEIHAMLAETPEHAQAPKAVGHH